MADDAPQVSADFYNFADYATFERWSSYWHQIAAVVRYRPRTMIEVGPGLGVTTHVLRGMGIEVQTFDYDADLRPDLLGDVRRLDAIAAPKSVDLVCAFQVLEHLPFEDLPRALEAIRTVARRHVLISLPHWGYPVELRGRLWKNRFAFAFARRIARPKTWAFDGQHYWELGAKGYSIPKVAGVIAEHLTIRRRYFCPDYSYHYFFECEVPE